MVDDGADGRSGPNLFAVPPLSSAHILRPRLVKSLSRHSGARLRVIRAGAGFGKTALLAEWARTAPYPVAPVVWVTADRSSTSRIAFWSTALTLIRAATGNGDAIVAPTPVRSDLESTLMASLLATFETLPEPVTLIVDEFERVTGTAVEGDLLTLVRQTAKLRLVVATRVASELDSWQSRITVDTVTIDDDQLRFSSNETRQLADRLGVELTASQSEDLQHMSGGWPFAVRAALDYYQRTASDPGWTATPDPAEGVQFVRRNLLDELAGHPGFPFLLTTSVVEAFSAELADALGAGTESGILTLVSQRGLGAWIDESSGPVFRVQPLLRQALLSRLTEDAPALSATYRRLSRWHSDRNETAAAFDAAIAAEDWAFADRCLKSAFAEITHELGESSNRLTDVPPHKLRGHPLLLFFAGLEYYGSGRRTRAVRRFVSFLALSPVRALPSSGPTSVDSVWLQGALLGALRLSGRFDLVKPAVRRFRRMIRECVDLDGELDGVIQLFNAQIATTYLYLDELTEAESILNGSTAPSLGSAPTPAKLHDLGIRALALSRAGHISHARELIDAINESEPPQSWQNSFYAVPAYLAAAHIHLEEFDSAAALDAVDAAESHWDTMEHWPIALEIRVRSTFLRSGPETALTVLRDGMDQKRSHPPISPALTARLRALEVRVHIASGRLDRARALVRTSRNPKRIVLEIERARLSLAEGRAHAAATLAQRLLEDPSVTLLQRTSLQLIAASAALRIGDRNRARQLFDIAFGNAQADALATAFAAVPEDDFHALAALSERGDLWTPPTFFPEPRSPLALTARERVVLTELASGKSLTRIAADLSVSPNTVKSQVRSVYRKLGVRNRAAAIREARARGVTDA